MTLADYMRANRLTDGDFAKLVGEGFSSWTVRKWRYGQRQPRPDFLRRIAEVTSGDVTPNDFIASPSSEQVSA